MTEIMIKIAFVAAIATVAFAACDVDTESDAVDRHNEYVAQINAAGDRWVEDSKHAADDVRAARGPAQAAAAWAEVLGVIDVSLNELGRIEPLEEIEAEHERLIELRYRMREPVAAAVEALDPDEDLFGRIRPRQYYKAVADFNRLRAPVEQENIETIRKINEITETGE